MKDHDSTLDLGMLCRCCDHSFKLPDLRGFSESERKIVEELCRLCADSFQCTAVNG